MNKRQRKKKFKKTVLNNLAESLKEVKLIREGKLPKTTWKDFKKELGLIK